MSETAAALAGVVSPEGPELLAEDTDRRPPVSTWRRRDQAAGRCAWCGEGVPDGQGVFHAGLRLSTHEGACHDAVRALYRVSDRSPRGRWRSTHEVLALIYLRSGRPIPPATAGLRR